MTEHIEKHYGSFEKDDFVDAINRAYDWPLFTFRGRDYVIDQRFSRKRGRREYFFADPLVLRGEERILSERYPSIDELLAASELDGKSFLDRYDELLVADYFEYVR